MSTDPVNLDLARMKPLNASQSSLLHYWPYHCRLLTSVLKLLHVVLPNRFPVSDTVERSICIISYIFQETFSYIGITFGRDVVMVFIKVTDSKHPETRRCKPESFQFHSNPFILSYKPSHGLLPPQKRAKFYVETEIADTEHITSC